MSVHMLDQVLLLSESLATEAAGELLLLHVERLDVSLEREL